MRYSQVLALLACAVETSGIATKTLPDGQVVRIPASKPLPSHPHTSNLKFGPDRTPKPKPKPSSKLVPPTGQPASPTGTPGASIPSLWTQQCGLERPSAEGFKQEFEDILAWFQKQYEAFRSFSESDNLGLYLQQIWAPKALSSGMFCDSVGSCNIASCLNLVDEGTNLGNGKYVSHHDRQMALYVFEWFANTDHVFAVMEKKLQDKFQELINTSGRMVDEFSSAKRIQDAAQREYKERSLGLQIGTSLALVIGGIAGFSSGNTGNIATLLVSLFFFTLFLFRV